MVIAYHLHNMAITGGFYHPQYGPLAAALLHALGRFGVLMFFMISGYLIVQSLVKSNHVPRFLTNRVWRICPVFILLHAIMFTLGPWLGYRWMSALATSPSAYALHFGSNLFFLPGVFPLPIAQKNAWSLSYEWAFYLIACCIFFGARRPGRGAVRLLALGVGLAASASMLFYHPVAAFFLVGVLLFLADDVVARRPTVPRLPAWAGSLLLVLAFTTYAGGWHVTSLALSVPFFFTIVHETGWFARLLRTRPLLSAGRVSYSLYLAHPFVLYATRALVAQVRPAGDLAAVAAFVGLGVTASLVAASLLHRHVEARFAPQRLPKAIMAAV